MNRHARLGFLLAFLVAAACLPPAAAAEPRGYHIYGNAALEGAPKEGAALHIRSEDGAVELTTRFVPANATDTEYGNMILTDRFGPGGPEAMEGWMHFFVEVPAGTYTLDITSGGRTFARTVEALGADHPTHEFAHGSYHLLDLGDVTLGEASAAQPAPTPATEAAPTQDATPEATPTTATTPIATATATPAGSTGTPAPSAGPDADPTTGTPGPAMALLLAGLAFAAVAFRRRV